MVESNALMCEHANEVPVVCTCPQDCYCRTHTCKLRSREGDQPLPTVNTHPAIQDLVIRDMEERKAVGLERYGTLLQPHNGRDVLVDLYQELLDACMYIRQTLYERDGK